MELKYQDSYGTLKKETPVHWYKRGTLISLLTEFGEAWAFMKEMTRDYNRSIKQQMRLLDHLEQDLSIHESDLLADMWDNLKHIGSLKISYIQKLESQIHLVKPKLVFLRNKYHIHYVFGSRAESELYDLYLARTVPFNTTAGSYQIDIKPTMKLQNVANMHSYIRPHELLSSCEQFENTFYCTKKIRLTNASRQQKPETCQCC